MCSTCSGFISRRWRIAIPNPQEEVVTKAEKMRDLMKVVLLHGPLQEIEPAEAMKEQWKVLQKRRMIMMETKKCPTSSGSLLLESCSISSREEGSKFMVVLPSQGRKERKTMVAAARSEQKLKQSREEPRRARDLAAD
jgi:hypothetical protein